MFRMARGTVFVGFLASPAVIPTTKKKKVNQGRDLPFKKKYQFQFLGMKNLQKVKHSQCLPHRLQRRQDLSSIYCCSKYLASLILRNVSYSKPIVWPPAAPVATRIPWGSINSCFFFFCFLFYIPMTMKTITIKILSIANQYSSSP